MGRKPKTTGPTARNNPEAFKQVLTRMGVAGWRALRMLAVERDTTINALAIEAFNDLLKKHGKRQSVEKSAAGRLTTRRWRPKAPRSRPRRRSTTRPPARARRRRR